MNKILSLALAVAFSCVSVAAIACPKGETLVGGTGPHHKGGKCVPKDAAAAKKNAAATAPAATADATAKVDDKAAKKAAADKAKADKKAAAAEKKAAKKAEKTTTDTKAN